jgi:hypothetical protein
MQENEKQFRFQDFEIWKRGADVGSKLFRLADECRELIAIFTAIGKTAKARRRPTQTRFAIRIPKSKIRSKLTIRNSKSAIRNCLCSMFLALAGSVA